MALDLNGTTITPLTDAEIAERVRFGQAKWEKLAQNQIAAKNLLDTIQNAWSNGSDVEDHFADPPPTTGSQRKGEWGTRDTAGHDEAGHFAEIGNGGNTRGSIETPHKRRIDRVETVFEAGVRVSAHLAAIPTFAGFTSDPTATHAISPAADGAWFERGSNVNTWKCVSRSGGNDRTVTDNQAGNYVTWDELRIEFTVASVKFFINGTLVATHTSILPVAVLLAGWLEKDPSSGQMDVDFARFVASENAVSP